MSMMSALSGLQSAWCPSSDTSTREQRYEINARLPLIQQQRGMRLGTRRMCVAAAGDDNRGTGDGWAKNIKDSLPDVRNLNMLQQPSNWENIVMVSHYLGSSRS